MSLATEVDVLIIGAGPVGTAAACALLNNLPEHARHAFKLLIVDRHPGLEHIPFEQSRALNIHARTLEVLSESIDDQETRKKLTGVRDRAAVPLLKDYASVPDRVESASHALLERGFMLTKITKRLKGNPVPIATCNLPEVLKDSQFPYMCVVQQRLTEAVLRARLNALGNQVEGGWKVVGLCNSSPNQPVTVTLEHPKLGSRTLQAGFVIGADGGHSAVRRLVGLSFPKMSWKDPLITADIKMADPKWPFAYRSLGYDGDEGGDYYCSRGFCVMYPMAHNWLRVAISYLPPGFDPELERAQAQGRGGHVQAAGPTMAQIQWAIDQALPTDVKWRSDAKVMEGKRPGDIVEVRWSSSFKIHEALVSSYIDAESGRIALIGDAAHVHSPKGGRGLNNGILDAVSLSQVLLVHPRPGVDRTKALAEWAEERRRICQIIMRDSAKQMAQASLRNPVLQMLRNCMCRVLEFFPGVTAAVFRRMAGLDQRPKGWKPVV